MNATSPGLIDQLTDDALTALDRHPAVAVRLVPERDTGVGCTVSGGYRGEETPPALLVTASQSRRRRAFTALHEFGHHLQRTDLDLAEMLLEHPDDEQLEEAACQAFASQVLLPDDLIGPITPERGPDATTVADYYRHSNASRAACCVRAVSLLIGGGVVVLCREDGTVEMAASTSLPPPAQNSDQSTTPLIARALSHPGRTVEHDDTTITYSTGTSDLLYGQAVWIDGYIVAVLKPDNVSWRPFAPPRTHTGTYTGRSKWATCDQCLTEFTVTADICPRCSSPRCPRRHCDCPSSVDERTCPRCTMTLHRARFSNFADATTPCRDCS